MEVKDLKIKMMANNIFIFTFPDEKKIDCIISMEPWNFNRVLLLLKKFEGFDVGDIGSFPTTHLWVRVFNISPFGMISDIGVLLVNTIGECICGS